MLTNCNTRNLPGFSPNYRTLGDRGRFAQLAPVIRRSFDVDETAPLLLALDRAERGATAPYDRKLRTLRRFMLTASTAMPLQRLEVICEDPVPPGITMAAGSSNPVKFRLRNAPASSQDTRDPDRYLSNRNAAGDRFDGRDRGAGRPRITVIRPVQQRGD